MRDQEIIGLWEAYQQVHSQPQELSEEVEIAAQYFYEMGLNEDGVDILIEELGVEEFGEFVYEIAEEYTLTEATRLQSGGAKLKGPKGSKPQSVTVRREKKQGGTTMKADAAPASTISPKKVAAAKKAKEKQPERKGILGRISQEVEKGMARHKAAMSAARETGKTIRKAAGHIGGVAREVGKGATGAVKLAGAVAKEVTKEEVDIFDIILEHLVAEGYADTNKTALAIMANMSEEWKQSIVEAEVLAQKGGVPGSVKVNKTKEGGFFGIGARTVNKPVPGSFRPKDVSSKDAARYNTGVDKKFGSPSNIDSTPAANVQYAANRAGHSGYMKVNNPSSIPDTGIPNRPSPGRSSDQNQARTMSSDIVRMNKQR